MQKNAVLGKMFLFDHDDLFFFKFKLISYRLNFNYGLDRSYGNVFVRSFKVVRTQSLINTYL